MSLLLTRARLGLAVRRWTANAPRFHSTAPSTESTAAQPKLSIGSLESIELNNKQCKTYLLSDPRSKSAAIVGSLSSDSSLLQLGLNLTFSSFSSTGTAHHPFL
jgi:hypothetical protein